MTRLTTVVTTLALAACGGGVGDAQKRLRTAIEAKQDALDDCYEKTLERDTEVKGNLMVVLKVAKGGGGVSSAVTGGKVKDGKLVKCVQGTLDAIKLKPAPGANMEVTYTLAFAPEG